MLMREFVYFSRSARTSGNFDTSELMKAGRMDIALHVIINTFFLSHSVRDDTKLHLVFYGAPDPPKHIEISAKTTEGIPETGSEVGSIDISKKDLAGLIKKILYKYREGKRTEVFKGIFVEKKPLLKVVEELEKQGKEIFILDKKGEDIREVEISEDKDKKTKDVVFILGDQDGFPQKELKRLLQIATPVSIGNKMYFASHVVTIVNNELDRRGI